MRKNNRKNYIPFEAIVVLGLILVYTAAAGMSIGSMFTAKRIREQEPVKVEIQQPAIFPPFHNPFSVEINNYYNSYYNNYYGAQNVEDEEKEESKQEEKEEEKYIFQDQEKYDFYPVGNGCYAVTAYNPYCKHCCGKSDGITASGKVAENMVSVAVRGIPFGTVIFVPGYGYFRVDDRCARDNIIDIAVCNKDGSHDGCFELTHSKCDLPIYEVKNKDGSIPDLW